MNVAEISKDSVRSVGVIILDLPKRVPPLYRGVTLILTHFLEIIISESLRIA